MRTQINKVKMYLIMVYLAITKVLSRKNFLRIESYVLLPELKFNQQAGLFTLSSLFTKIYLLITNVYKFWHKWRFCSKKFGIS